jgi:hypothetical protein
MTESQFYKATHDGVCGFEIITYKTEERTSDVGAIPGVYEKVITCFIEGVIAARLTIYVSTFETKLEAAKKKGGGLEYIFDWQLKGYIRKFSKDLVELLQFRNKKTDEIDKFMTKRSLPFTDRYHLLGFILGRCVIGYSSNEDKRKNNFHTFVNFIIKSFGWENYFRLEVIKHDEPEEGNG